MKDDTFLARWLAGELNDTELKAFKEQEPERYGKLMRIKQHFETIQKPELDTETMLSQIVTAEKSRVVPLKPRRKYLVPAVAAAAVILLVMGIVFTRPEKMAAANGATMAFNLPDASSVQLNAGSDAQYSGWNWDSNRRVTLNGEAYFKVAKGKTFTVQTALGTVQVVGTQFNVKARDNKLEVTCYEGKVKVVYNKTETLLTPGNALYITNGIAETAVVTDVAPAWLKGELVFYRETLAGITAEMERKYNVQIKMGYTSGKTFTGALPGNDINQTFDLLSKIYPVKTEKQNSTYTISPTDSKK